MDASDNSSEIIEELDLFWAFSKELSEDWINSYKLLLADDSQFHRRTYIRTAFSYIEGNIFRMKQSALAVGKILKHNNLFSNAEVSILEERCYELDDKGKAIDIKAKLQLVKNLRFAFVAFAKATSAAFELPVNSAGWEAFKKTIKVRDRLMHPKQIADLSITDEELRTAKLAFDWFMENEHELEKLSVRTLEQNLNFISERTDKLIHILNTEGEEGLRNALDRGEFDNRKIQ